MANTTEIVSVRSSDSISALDEFDAILRGVKKPEQLSDDPAAIQREIVEQILSATTDEELELGEATPWQNLLGIPVEIYGFRFRPSDYKEGAPVFVVVQAIRLDTGQAVVLTTGGFNVLAQLSNLARRERFPSVWKLAEPSRATAAGHMPLRLIAVTSEVAEANRAMQDDGTNPLDEV